MTKCRNKLDAVLWVFVLAVICGLFVTLGCSNVRGFQYADDGTLSPSVARAAADMARAEAEALDNIADRNSEHAGNIADAATGLAESLGAPAAVGGILGALATLWVPPPGTRRKKEAAKEKAD